MTPEEQLLKAIAQTGTPSQLPSDEILARYVDGSLDETQHARVSAYLAQNPERRRQWRAVQEAQAYQVLHRQKSSAYWRIAGVASAAAVLLFTFVVTQNNEQANAPIMTVVLMPQTEPASSLARNAVPVNYWRAYLAGYTQPEQSLSSVSPQIAEWQVLGASLSRLQSQCGNEALLRVAEGQFDSAVADYPHLTQIKPTTQMAWCAFGEKLQQKAMLSVSLQKQTGEPP
ncbi:anti-sigma factor [Zhongshania sp.]|uniref:anti-sigma factor family protein n=1 Tax=Zhongshania sp. TaxID=1971902 RepID=UPI0035648947